VGRQRKDDIRASERLDILEDELPASMCAVRQCGRARAHYGVESFTERVFYVCARHRVQYNVHNQIMARIRSL
jgi:hypothetical protein